MKRIISFNLNGVDISVEVEPAKYLLETLNDELGIQSVRYGCGESICGTCTVLLEGKAVHSCCILMGQIENKRVVTVEGIGTPERLHPLQEAFLYHWGSQCGYCTPGMILSAYALLMENQVPTRDAIKAAISGNLCRCTGYTKIIKAIYSLAGLGSNKG